jgi:hypothetical protein
MNWLKKIAQAYSVEQIIQGVLSNNFDINWAAQYLGETHGEAACEALEYAAGTDATAVPKMRVLSQGAGCSRFEPQLPQAPDEFAQPPGIAPELGAQEKPMDIPSTEIV